MPLRNDSLKSLSLSFEWRAMYGRPATYNRYGPSNHASSWYAQPARANVFAASAGSNMRFGEFVRTQTVTHQAAYSKEKVKELTNRPSSDDSDSGPCWSNHTSFERELQLAVRTKLTTSASLTCRRLRTRSRNEAGRERIVSSEGLQERQGQEERWRY